MSLNELGEKLQAAIIIGKFLNKPTSNSHWLIVLGNVYNWSKSKAHSHIFFLNFWPSFDSSRYLLLGVYFSPHQRNIASKYKLQRKAIMKKKTFSLVSDIDVEKSCFFNEELKFLINNF